MKKIDKTCNGIYKYLVWIVGLYLLLLIVLSFVVGYNLEGLKSSTGVAEAVIRCFEYFIGSFYIPLAAIYYGIKTSVMKADKLTSSCWFVFAFIVVILPLYIISNVFSGGISIVEKQNVFTLLSLVMFISALSLLIAFVLSLVSSHLTSVFLKRKNQRK